MLEDLRGKKCWRIMSREVEESFFVCNIFHSRYSVEMLVLTAGVTLLAILPGCSAPVFDGVGLGRPALVHTVRHFEDVGSSPDPCAFVREKFGVLRVQIHDYDDRNLVYFCCGTCTSYYFVQAQDLWVFVAVSVSSAGAQAPILSPMLSSWSGNWNLN